MLRPQTQYYARVKAINASSESEYSNIISVVTLPSTLINEPTSSPINPSIYRIVTNSNNVFIYINKPQNQEIVDEYKLTLSSTSDYSQLLLNKLIYSINKNIATAFINDIEYYVINISNLLANTDYYGKLQAANSIGLSQEITFNFKTKTLLNPPDIIGAVEISPINAIIAWYPVNNALSYRLDVADNPNFTSSIINNVSVNTTQYTINGLIENTTYFYRIRSQDSSTTSNNSRIASFTTTDNSVIYNDGAAINLNTPIILNKTEILPNSIKIKWLSVPDANNYQIQIADNSNYSNPIIDTTVKYSEYIANGLISGELYFIRVRAEKDGIYSAYSTITATTLITENSLTPPQLLNITSNYSKAATLNWVKRSYATNYFIQISTNTSFSNIIQTVYTKDTDSYYLSNLTPNSTYYARIAGLNNTVISEFSSYITITTSAALTTINNLRSEVYDNKVILKWDTNSSYNKYLLSVYRIEDNSLVSLNDDIFFKRDLGNVNNFELNILLKPDTTYNWILYGVTNDGDIYESTAQEFITLAPAPYIYLDSRTGNITWSGNLNKLSIATDKDFKYTLPEWSNRQIFPYIARKYGILSLLEDSPHLYIQGYFEDNNTTSKKSNIIYTYTSQPIFLTPIITDSSITIRWKKSNTDGYGIRIDKNISPGVFEPLATYLSIIDIGDVNEYTISNLEPYTTYKIFLYIKKPNGEFQSVLQPVLYTTYVSADNFDLSTSLSLSALNITINDISYDRAYISFSNISPGQLITYRASQSDDFYTNHVYKQIDTTEDVIYLKPSTTYYIDAIIVNPLTGQRSVIASETFTTLDSTYIPEVITTAPILSNLVVINTNEVRLNFTNVNNAKGYVLEVSKSSNFAVLDYDVNITYFNNHIIINGLLSNAVYYARMYAFNEYSITNYSSSITIDTTP